MDEYEVRRADGLLQDALLKKYYSGDDLGTLVAEAKHELDVAQNNFDNATDKV